MTRQTRRHLVDRKIVERLVSGCGVNAIARTLRVSKRRSRNLRAQAWTHGYLKEEGGPGEVKLPPYPERLFPDVADGRAGPSSELDRLLAPKTQWIRECLQAGWHAVSVYEELTRPPTGIGPVGRPDPNACIPVSVNGQPATTGESPLTLGEISRSSFYRYLERHTLTRLGEKRRVVPEIVHRPGEALLLDWGKLRDVVDPSTNRKRALWMFAGVMGYSRYLMARLVWTMDLATTLLALEGFLREIQGVPSRVTTDNPKCIALEASAYEPLLNPGVERFAAHYGLTVECLPPRDPQKKGKIERPMPFLRRLYEAHGEGWQGLEESQTYLDGKLALANQRRHGTTHQRPLDLLAAERTALPPLPSTAYAVEQFHEGPVRQDSHVRFDGKYYSVDEQHCGKSVVVLGGTRQVSIYLAGKY